MTDPKYQEKNVGVMEFGIRRIKMADLFEFVSIALKEDEDLITKYHLQDATMQELILNNVKNIEELAKTKEVKCYGVFLEDQAIGFSVISEQLLYSFGINVYCRQKEIVLNWLKGIKKIMKDNFVVCLYRENTRAINFFLRNGLEEFSEDGKVIYLLYSK